jgi:hypothetical protein
MLDPWCLATIFVASACLNNQSKPGRSFLMSKSVILLFDSLYAEAIEAEKSRAALSASTPDLISISSDINSDARL